jgi:hypothetical protein
VFPLRLKRSFYYYNPNGKIFQGFFTPKEISEKNNEKNFDFFIISLKKIMIAIDNPS